MPVLGGPPAVAVHMTGTLLADSPGITLSPFHSSDSPDLYTPSPTTIIHGKGNPNLLEICPESVF